MQRLLSHFKNKHLTLFAKAKKAPARHNPAVHTDTLPPPPNPANFSLEGEKGRAFAIPIQKFLYLESGYFPPPVTLRSAVPCGHANSCKTGSAVGNGYG